MLTRRLGLAVAVAAYCASVPTQTLLGQEARRAAVMTAKGDLVEGSLKAVSETEAVIEIAGQAIRIPLGDIRYISFVGKIEGSGTTAAATLTPMEKAFASLKDLRAATEVGMLRTQYAQKLVETLPTVRAFVEGADGKQWADVRVALASAMAHFQAPMADLDAWKNAGVSMGRGVAFADYAMKLAGIPGEESHSEEPSEKTIAIGDEVRGRLGMGDRTIDAKLDRSTEGALNDVYTLVVTDKQRLTIEMVCSPCTPHLTVALAGKSVEGDMGTAGKSTIRFDAIPNRYQIWAGTTRAGVGEYVLKITSR